MSQDFLNKNQFKSKNGQSLTEIMVAIVFFGLIAVSLSLPLSNSLFATYDNQNINTANTLARSYLKDLQDSWKLQGDFDTGTLITPGTVYTENSKYTVSTTSADIQTDTDGNVLIRRVTVTYSDDNGAVLCELYFDFNRPAGT